MSEKFRVEAHHAYTKAKPDELDLSPGDIIRVLSDEHASWWVGHKEGTDEQGWFPSNFVRKIEPKPESKSKSKPKREVRIVKQYDATDEDDLSLRVGDIVEIKKEVDGWYLGRLNGNIGMFPVSYAEELQGDLPSSTGRPLPVPPVPGASTQPPPVPGALSRRSTASSGTAPGGALPTMPPTLPSRTPPLPPRASTDVGRPGEKSHAGAAATAAAEEGADDSKKDKTKSSHRISRLFGTKKHKNKDAQPEGAEQPRTEQQPSAAHDDEEDADESALSPDIPSRPLPQPARMNSPPPPAGRAVPPIPPMGMATLPPIPAAAMPSQPTASAQLEPAAPRRPSVSSVATTSSIATAPIPPVPQTQRSASNVSAGEDGYLEEDADADNAAVYAEDGMSKDEAAGDETEEPNSRPSAKLAKIIEDYEAQSPEELNLLLGDVVTIINRGTENEERWKGEYHGKKGYFPGHVVELIEESAGLDEEGDESGEATSKPKGFKLAAYGVQQGGLGSIFAAGGMPALRKSTPRKNSEAEPSSDASTSVLAPVPTIPKLRSVQRSQPKEDQKEEQPNFLANLNRVPRKPMASASSEESPSTPSQPMPVPALPISRKSTTTSFAEPEAAEAKETLAGAGTQPENVPDAAAQTIDSSVPLDATVPQEERSGYRPDEALDEQEEHAIEDDSGDVQSAEDNQAIAGGAQPAKKSPALDPVKSPALASAKRLVRRGPRQMPTAEGLKKNSEESQSQSLRAALQNDKSVEPEAEPEVVKALRQHRPRSQRTSHAIANSMDPNYQ
ncbi:hypothetical protein BX070DRAFT_77990 [Coemansia spiralis]|nr:hypothetical protein BX070DRAFT_77990 [Coemansia spiralis]